MTRPTKLPDADWLHRRGLSALIAALDGKARYVGGAVRDTLLGLEVKDVDIATPLLPENVMERLRAADIKVIPTGIEHGTVTAVLPDGPVEITTLRRDVSTDGRRATVAFSDDWKEDAARRDFTMNAMFADPWTLDISDYFDGLADLDAQCVRFIGTAQERIAEDHLRILRYFRFLARFGQDNIDQEAFGACRSAAAELTNLSRERISDELMKLLATEAPVYAVKGMIAADIFDHIISAIDPQAIQVLEPLIKREQEFNISPNPVRRLVGLLPKDPAVAGEIAKSLRLSKKLQRAVSDRLDFGNVDPDYIPVLAYRRGAASARDIALLFANDEYIEPCLNFLESWEKPDFPLKGGDLITMGLEPGPIVATTLAAIEQTWIDEKFPNEARVRSIAVEKIATAV
ncbi:MAG: CCA tRNA nucleotidyltransferase [Parasphingorhabdus sp.]